MIWASPPEQEDFAVHVICADAVPGRISIETNNAKRMALLFIDYYYNESLKKYQGARCHIYCNSSDYYIDFDDPGNTALPDGIYVDAYNYNFSCNLTNWDGNLFYLGTRPVKTTSNKKKMSLRQFKDALAGVF